MSIYFTSTWQYLSETDPTATVDFFGAILALTALAGAFGNPLLGWWNQKSGSTRYPVIVAFGIAAIGNFIYAFAYLSPNIKYTMLFARILTGFGPGALGVLRSFVGTASTKADRMKAVSIGNCGFTGGFFIGPTIQICFIPLGKIGYEFSIFRFNMYTTCALFMTVFSIFSVILTIFCLKENYVGIISNEDKSSDPFFVLPKFDRSPVFLLYYMWWLLCGTVCVESMAAPLTIAMYSWNPEDAVLYNGIIQTVGCAITFSVNFCLASTKLKDVDNRILLLVGLFFFAIFFVFHLPNPLYPGPLDGLCDYDWCSSTPRVPLYLYLFIASVVLGVGFPLISSSSSSLLSQILGPRRQGTAQGFFAFTGSFSQFVVSLFSTSLFNASGYKWIMCYHLAVVTFAILGVSILWPRLTPLKITPTPETPTKYKSGTFYRM
ncbi:unnamed protein product [Caenorhabditis angaria]|uniref:Major facilitator superfamily (MFS) profile domain-containing protein n=1 Tax=Caenorhabditis angaria TaxID=860376 RepID=A0A9P1IMF7_9PELO|nr:unnamed protein product [Caenorhabditis angaria]